MRRWLKGEPRLSDVLADPVVQLMMRRDRVDPDHLYAFLRRVGGTLAGAGPQRSAWGFESAPDAEIGSHAP